MNRIVKFGKIWINPEHITHMDTPDDFIQDREHGYTVVMHMVSGKIVATTMVGYPSQDAALAERMRTAAGRRWPRPPAGSPPAANAPPPTAREDDRP